MNSLHAIRHASAAAIPALVSSAHSAVAGATVAVIEVATVDATIAGAAIAAAEIVAVADVPAAVSNAADRAADIVIAATRADVPARRAVRN
jgi:hypothetical protein